jgi:hypothetical protein
MACQGSAGRAPGRVVLGPFVSRSGVTKRIYLVNASGTHPLGGHPIRGSNLARSELAAEDGELDSLGREHLMSRPGGIGGAEAHESVSFPRSPGSQYPRDDSRVMQAAIEDSLDEVI